MKASDLTGEAKQLFEEWRALGYTERQALDRVERSGLVREPELYKGFREFFGLSREAASIAALGRDPEPSADPRERTVAAFRELGLSEGAAEIAADGRDGSPTSSTGQSPAASAPVEESGLEWHLRVRRELADLDRMIQETKAMQEERWRREDEAKVNRERKKLGLPPVDLDRYR